MEIMDQVDFVRVSVLVDFPQNLKEKKLIKKVSKTMKGKSYGMNLKSEEEQKQIQIKKRNLLIE